MSVLVAAAQFAATDDKTQNLESMRQLLATAASHQADLIVFPENSMYSDHAKVHGSKAAIAETINGDFANALRALATENNIAIVAGMTEVADGDQRTLNTLIHIERDGSFRGQYRKLHLYDAFGYRESDTVVPAKHANPLVFEMGGVRFGAMTCYDLRFPEMARVLSDSNVDAILAPSAWVAGPMKEMHWEILLRARAIENTSYVVGVGQTGPACTGQSMIIDPMGAVVSCAAEEPGVVFATVSADRVVAVRQKNPSVSNRRFDVTPRT